MKCSLVGSVRVQRVSEGWTVVVTVGGGHAHCQRDPPSPVGDAVVTVVVQGVVFRALPGD